LSHPSVVLAGYYGFGNAGDELLLHALVRGLRRDAPDTVITVLSNRPDDTARTLDVQAVNRWRPLSWLKPLIAADRFILGGGGLLQESTGPWNHLYYLSLVLLARLGGCETEIKAIGVDRLRRPLNRFWTRFVLNHWVDRLSVRDATSRDYLIETGVRSPITVEDDLVFSLPPAAGSHRGEGVALAISPLARRPTWSRDVAELCDRLAAAGGSPIDLLVFFPAQDAGIAREVSRLCPAIRGVRQWNNPTDLLAWIPEYRMILGTRYHALVLAQANRLPFVGWGSQEKVATLCRTSGKPFWNCAQEEWNLDRQLQQILAAYEPGNKSVILTRTA
jgi:polysaccharide pyruvyl transferase CsaB